MDQTGTTQHCRPAGNSQRYKDMRIRAHAKNTSDGLPPTGGSGKSWDYKDQLLCELELQRTVSAEQIRSLEKIRHELEQTQGSLTAFYTKSPIGYVTLTPTGLVLDANLAAIALLGVDRARLNRLPFSLLVHRTDVRRFLAHLARCKESKAEKVITELRLRTPVDEPARVQLISLPVGRALHRVVLTSIVDISDRIRSEKELAEAKEFSESIVDTVSQPLAVLDGDLRIVSINRAYIELFKQPAEYARGRVFEVMLNLWWSGNALRSELEKVLVRDQPLAQFEVNTDLRDVGKRTLLLNARRLFRKQGSPPLILVAMEDITVRKHAEAELRLLNQELESRVAARTDALKKSYEQMEAFCYSIAHDLRAPLRSMTGFSNILLTDYAPQLDPKASDYIGRIHQSAERMDQLIRDLLNYGRLNTAGLEIQDVNLDETFRTIVTHNEQEITEKHAKITRTGTLPRVRGHAIVLQTILSNLISNAMKFVAPGIAPVVSVSCEDRGAFARIWVVDNGIGIAPQNRAKIFGVFERLHSVDHYPGTGIGLAIVHKGIERMGGQVGVESQLNKGSRFWIELPKSKPPSAPAGNAA
jgi:PAS domain S-box-containing protein